MLAQNTQMCKSAGIDDCVFLFDVVQSPRIGCQGLPGNALKCRMPVTERVERMARSEVLYMCQFGQMLSALTYPWSE
jgi:hypothetical protein